MTSFHDVTLSNLSTVSSHQKQLVGIRFQKRQKDIKSFKCPPPILGNPKMDGSEATTIKSRWLDQKYVSLTVTPN